MSAENRISLEWMQIEIKNCKTNEQIKEVLFEIAKLLIGNYDKFTDFFT